MEIEAGFKEIKQEIGSSKSQTRNYHAVTNHLNFCMMAATVTWIYAHHNVCLCLFDTSEYGKV